MVKAILNGVVIAETDKYEVVEGNKYFPSESIKTEYFSNSDTQCVDSFSRDPKSDSLTLFLAVLHALGKGNLNLLRIDERPSPILPESRLTTTFLSPMRP